MNWARMRKTLLESVGIFAFAPLISMFAGVTLNSEFQSFVQIPMLLALAPLLNGLAGDFGTIIVSSVNTALHLGTVRPKMERNRNLERYLATDFLATIITSLYMCVVLYVLSEILNLGGIPIFSLFTVTLISCVIIISIISVSSVAIAFFSYSLGLDPANIAFPIVTAIGDFSGAISLVFVARMIGVI